MEITQIPSGEQVCEELARQSSTVMLAFSTGKDSIGAWIQLRRYFKRIIPFYMYPIPGLRFVADDIKYFEDFFGSKVIQVPHPSFYRMLNNLVFQPPERVAIIEAAAFPEPTYEHVVEMLREDEGVDPKVYCATGVRAADSPIRYAAVKKHGPINHKRKTFWPVWDWNKARLRAEMKKSGVKLGLAYKWFGRSFDGVDYRFLYLLKQNSPADFQRILDWFPLAEVELLRREYVKQKVS